MKKGLVFGLLMLVLCSVVGAQDSPLTDSLKLNLENATTDEQRILWLGELSAFYLNLNASLSNEYGRRQIEIAELSRDRKLMLKALLSSANRHYNASGTKENISKGKDFSQRALALAKSSHMDDYMAWSYIYLARGARNDGNNDQALNYSNLAFTLASSIDNDSLKVYALNSLGGTYLARNEKLLAFRNFLQAMNLAEALDSYDMKKRCYYLMANFYGELNDYEKTKDYLYKIEKLTLDVNDRYERLGVYGAIGRTYTLSKQYELATRFYEKELALADTLKMEILKLNAYLNILNQYLASNQAEKALQYFNERKELRDFMMSAGFDYFLNHAYAIAYTGLGKYDSAGYYFNKAKPGFESKTHKLNLYGFYDDYAGYLQKKGDYKTSVEYWLKARQIAEERNDLDLLQATSSKLDSLYQKLGDFKSAYRYNVQYHQYKDSVEKLSTEKDLLLLEVDNENKRKEREAVAAEEAKRARHNIQYMGITAAIAGVFILLVMLGIFSVSKTTIRILGFFAFIFLFEFIILLADNQIHHWTHGEPWKILAIKIGLISILLPLHHFLEEKVIHYLTTRKMMEVNPKELLSKLSGSTKEA